MKKIGNFTQTYQVNPLYTWGSDGRDREFLLDFLERDKNQLWLRKNIDLHTYTFHNYDIERAKEIGKRLKSLIPSTKCMCYNNVTYGKSFLLHLNYLKSQGITDVLWIQDDEFTVHSNINDFKDFLNFYKKRPDINHVSLSVHKDRLTNNGEMLITDNKGEYINDNLIIYKTNCQDYFNFDKHAFPSGAVICDINMLLEAFNQMPEITNTTNAYQVEDILCSTGYSRNFQRCTLNTPLFGVFNITGMGGSLGHAEFYLEELNKKFNTDKKLDDLWN